MANLESIHSRFRTLLLNFALKCSENEKTKDMLPLAKNYKGMRNSYKFDIILARKEKLYKSTIPTMARMLNEYYNTKN